MNDFTKPFDPELAIKLSKLVHDQCDRPPHDIGASLAQIVHEHIKPRTPAEAEGKEEVQ